jgi:hypothetical protein
MRYAIYNDAGIIDGTLCELSPNVASEEAQALLVRQIEGDSGLTYVATWKLDQPRWWSAELVMASNARSSALSARSCGCLADGNREYDAKVRAQASLSDQA